MRFHPSPAFVRPRASDQFADVLLRAEPRPGGGLVQLGGKNRALVAETAAGDPDPGHRQGIALPGPRHVLQGAERRGVDRLWFVAGAHGVRRAWPGAWAAQRALRGDGDG